MKRSAQVVWIYSRLLRLYPRQYRAEYGEELQTVFGLMVDETVQQGAFLVIRLVWRELRDLPGTALREHWHERIKSTQRRKMENETNISPTFEPASWRVGLVTMTPFLLWALDSLVHYLARSLSTTPPRWVSIISGLGLYLLSVLLLLILGMIKGLPRWSLPCAGLIGAFISVGFTDAIINLVLHSWTPWVMLHLRGSWLVRSICNAGVTWLSLLGIVVLSVLISAGWRRLRPFYRRIRDDWTLLSFGIYGAAQIGLLVTFDDYPYYEPYTVVASLILAAGAWAYLRSARPWQRFRALFAGVTLAMAVAAAGKGIIYTTAWPGRRLFTWQTEVGSTVVLWGWLVTMILLPALLALLPRPDKPLPAGQPVPPGELFDEREHSGQTQTSPPPHLSLTEPTAHILLNLAQGKKHGYAILKDVETLGSGSARFSTSTLYSALDRLLDQGLIERVPNDEREHTDSDLPRKAYILSETGQWVLEAEVSRLQPPLAVAHSRLDSKAISSISIGR